MKRAASLTQLVNVVKRARNDGASPNEYELRDAKVQKVIVFKKEQWLTLDSHDVVNNIFRYMKLLVLTEMWFRGQVQLFTSKFLDGDTFFREVHVNPFSVFGVFSFWHSFLTTVSRRKEDAGVNHHLTIQTANYYSATQKTVVSWESFHRGKFMIAEGSDDEDNNAVAVVYPQDHVFGAPLVHYSSSSSSSSDDGPEFITHLHPDGNGQHAVASYNDAFGNVYLPVLRPEDQGN